MREKGVCVGVWVWVYIYMCGYVGGCIYMCVYVCICVCVCAGIHLSSDQKNFQIFQPEIRSPVPRADCATAREGAPALRFLEPDAELGR